MTIDALITAASEKVYAEHALASFLEDMHRKLPGPSHPHVGVLSGRRVQDFQNWLLANNHAWRLTDGQLLAVMRTEFPHATGKVFTGDVAEALKLVRGIRAHYNRDGHGGPSPSERGLGPSVSYGNW